MGLADTLRNADLTNRLLRYNPFFRRRIERIYSGYAHADAHERQAIRKALLDKTLVQAGKTTYGRAYAAQALAQWPILAKDTVRERPDDFMTGSIAKIPGSTGGTTGQPLPLYRSLENLSAERFAIEHLMHEHDLNMRTSRLAVLRADEVKAPEDQSPPFGVYRNGGQTLVLSNAHLSSKTLDWFVAELNRFKPDVLYVYPSMLENFIAMLEAKSLQLRVPLVLSSSEMSAAHMASAAKRVLDADVIDYYGQGERVALAVSRNGSAFRFDPLYGTTELIAEPELDADDGRKAYKIIATGHWNSAMPLVRYETGDIALVDSAAVDNIAAIETGEATFSGLLGRRSEYVFGPDGEVCAGLNHIPRDVPHLLRVQVIQESLESLTLNVLVAEGWDAASEAKLVDNLRQLVPPAMRIAVQRQDALERAANQKIPFVIRRVTP
ncbi:MAG: hypothetical protein AAGA84_10360 [Pseudomonadota bacterium]